MEDAMSRGETWTAWMIRLQPEAIAGRWECNRRDPADEGDGVREMRAIDASSYLWSMCLCPGHARRRNGDERSKGVVDAEELLLETKTTTGKGKRPMTLFGSRCVAEPALTVYGRANPVWQLRLFAARLLFSLTFPRQLTAK
jgi:hypothetical protein